MTLNLRVSVLAFGLALSSTPAAFSQDISIVNFHPVTDGAVYRSGKPTVDEVEQLKALGIKTVLSLETYMTDPDDGDEEANAVETAGMHFVRVPMSPLPFDPPSVDAIQSAVDILKAPENQPALVHCYHGSDRTGIVVGAYHIEVDGWAADEAIADMRNYGHSWLFFGWDDLLYQF